jgi:hypothetical protein
VTVPAGDMKATDIPEEIDAKALVEPVEKNETRRLIASAAQIYDFCTAWHQLDALPEPDPGDVDDVAEFSVLLHDTLRLINTARKVQERVPAGRGRPARVKAVDLTPEAIADVQQLRTQAYAYRVRVAYWKQYFDQGLFDAVEMKARMDRAFVLLASEDVTRVEQRLSAYEQEHCDL